MADHGFKLFLVKVHQGFGHTPVNLAKTGDQLDKHFAETICDIVTPELAVTLDGRPILVEMDGGDVRLSPTNELRCRWDACQRSATHVSFVFRYGRVGDFDVAMGATSEVPIDDKATTRPYRVELLLPPAGDTGVLAVETVGVSHPTEMFTRWAGLHSKRRSKKLETAALTPPWWRWILDPYPDPKQLDALIQNGSKVTLELTKYKPTAGGNGTYKDLVLIQEVHTQSKLKQTITTLTSWAKSGSQVNAASDVSSLVNQSVGGLGFTDGEIVIEDKTGRRKRLTPTKMDDVFIYPIPAAKGNRPTAGQWEAEVRSKIADLAAEKKLQLDW
ncbi:hypothetical protein [Nocardioides pantholopis]|uniref:hypothetical protein n=1 Tax=Nocardioides pantholopis TaxID=2483798 RepID=UPI000FD6E2A5|nr:hypothetical protein [Nocardioides pantholopis]